MKRKRAATSRRDAARCFAVCAAADKTTTACRYKRKNGDSWVAVGQDAYAAATCAGAIALDKSIRIEVWQTGAFTPSTPIEDVVNVPLLPTQILVYPLILRAQGDGSAVPTVGKLRRLLSEHMKTQTQLHHQVDDEDDTIDSINDTATIGSVSTEEAVNSDSNASDTELESDSENELDACHGADDTDDSATDEEELDVDLDDDEVVSAAYGRESKRRHVLEE